MATKRAAKRQGGAAEVRAPKQSPTPAPVRFDDAVLLPLAGIEAQLTALRSDGQAMQRQLELIGGALRTAILSDVFALIAQTDAPELSELQRRAQAIQIELTLRRQEVALAEWRRKLDAATQESERQRQLFARLETDFERRSADFEHRAAAFEHRSADFERCSAQLDQVAGELERVSADFAHRSAEYERTLDAARGTETMLRAALDEQSTSFQAKLAEQAKAFENVQEEREAAVRSASAARESAFEAALAEREARLAATTGELERSIALAETRGTTLHSCEQSIAALAQELTSSRDENAALRDEVSELRAVLGDREKTLAEAERRIEELRSSRWRRLGVGLGVARRATFE
jgi:chromosome segregation ATPase